MHKKNQILMFYLLLVILFFGVAYKFSKPENKMINAIASVTIAVGISALLWQNYGRYMAY
jgi:hypothetical protein